MLNFCQAIKMSIVLTVFSYKFFEMKELKSSTVSERDCEGFLITACVFEKLPVWKPGNHIWEHVNLKLYYSIFIILNNIHASLI